MLMLLKKRKTRKRTMRFDLHIHSSFSPCSDLAIDEILNEARSRGLDGVCITDHHTMKAGRLLKEGIQSDGLCVIVGMEYSTSDGDFLIFGPFEDIASDLSATELLEFVKQNDGVAVAAHPFRDAAPVSEYVVRERLCHIIEGVNGRNSTKENRPASDWVDAYDVTVCAGSDAHSLQELGKAATEIFFRVRSRDDFITALKNGLCEID